MWQLCQGRSWGCAGTSRGMSGFCACCLSALNVKLNSVPRGGGYCICHSCCYCCCWPKLLVNKLLAKRRFYFCPSQPPLKLYFIYLFVCLLFFNNNPLVDVLPELVLLLLLLLVWLLVWLRLLSLSNVH